jgi:hypothetical protein
MFSRDPDLEIEFYRLALQTPPVIDGLLAEDRYAEAGRLCEHYFNGHNKYHLIGRILTAFSGSDSDMSHSDLINGGKRLFSEAMQSPKPKTSPVYKMNRLIATYSDVMRSKAFRPFDEHYRIH